MDISPEFPPDAPDVSDAMSDPVVGARREKRLRKLRRKWLTISTILSGVGRTLITAGLLILLFVAYQLWGTGLYTSAEQDKLDSAFARAQQVAETTSTTTTTTTSAAPAPPGTQEPPLKDAPAPPLPPQEGTPLAQIRIPKIEVNWTVVEGTAVPDLRKGPGHYRSSPMPGQLGNAAIAGHRTTYGAPFNRLDELKIGDEIRIETLWGGNYLYRVTALTLKDGYSQDLFGASITSRDADSQGVFPVSPSSIDVLGWYKNTGAAATDPYLATLTLTTCHPEFSARQRLVATAVLSTKESDAPVAAPTEQQQKSFVKTIEKATNLDETSHRSEFDSERNQAIMWGAIAFCVGMLWWFVFHRRKKWYVWILGALPFLAVLFMCYVHIERMMPTSI